jgi:precorrin-6A/cobalt-precorrin-6A reductase
MHEKTILVLGGTVEARLIVKGIRTIFDESLVYSLAGITSTPVLPTCEIRAGGFGGVSGLKNYIENESVVAIIDATHPYAAQMSTNVCVAATELSVPLLRFERSAWERQPKDNWHFVSSVREAALSLPNDGSKVFLAIGKKELDAFKAQIKDHFLIRSVEDVAPEDLPLFSSVIQDRGPFPFDQEWMLLKEHEVSVVVCKNSGGHASYGKVEACRDLGIKVIMIERPPLPKVQTVEQPIQVTDWLEAILK